MQKYIIFFVVILASGFIYFSYITMISKSLKDQGRPAPTKTEQILAEQGDKIKQLNKDYRDIIEQSRRQADEAVRHFDHDAVRRDQKRVLEDNKRQIEDNRRQMEQLRRDMKHR